MRPSTMVLRSMGQAALLLPSWLGLWIVLCALGWAPSAHAVPPFARRYGFSCGTCHVGGPPKLSPFGEAFRDNGYRIPGEDPSFLRDPPIPLGSEKRMRLPDAWKNNVWPGELPGSLPIGVTGTLGGQLTLPPAATGDAPTAAPRATVSLLLAGSLGEHLSLFGIVTASPEGVSVDQIFGQGRSLLARVLGENTLNIKVGRMALDLFAVQPRLGRSALFSLPQSLTIGRDGFALSNPADGIELYGLLGGRLKWVFAAVNGQKPLDDFSTRRDLAGRLQLKLFGNRLDLRDAAPEDPVHVLLGALFYAGVGVVVPTLPEVRFGNEVTRLGMDVRLRARKLDLLGQVLLGQDTDPLGLGDRVRHLSWSLSVEYALFPWLQPLVRFEESRADTVLISDRRRLVLGIQGFVRPNVRVRIEGAAGLSDREPHVLLADLFLAL